MKEVYKTNPPLIDGINADKIQLDGNNLCYGRCCRIDRHKSITINKIVERVVIPNVQKLVPKPEYSYPSDEYSITNCVETVDFKGMMEAMRDIYFQGVDDFSERQLQWKELLNEL